MNASEDTSIASDDSTNGSSDPFDPDGERMQMLREMLRYAEDPHDPENGIYSSQYPFAKIAIERMLVVFPERSGHLTQLDEARKRSSATRPDGTEPPFGGEFHKAMLAGFRYAVMIFDEWISMQQTSCDRIVPSSEGPSDGSCTG